MFVDWQYFQFVVMVVQVFFGDVQQFGQVCVGEVFVFEFVYQFVIDGGQVEGFDFFFVFDQVFDLYQELFVDVGQFEYFFDVFVGVEGVGDVLDMFGVGYGQFVFEDVVDFWVVQVEFWIEVGGVDFQVM